MFPDLILLGPLPLQEHNPGVLCRLLAPASPEAVAVDDLSEGVTLLSQLGWSDKYPLPPLSHLQLSHDLLVHNPAERVSALPLSRRERLTEAFPVVPLNLNLFTVIPSQG
jgi:hypothetical protein